MAVREICTICNKPLLVPDSRLRASVSRAISHVECFAKTHGEKPYHAICLEKDWGRPIEEILVETTRLHDTTASQLEELRISQSTLKRWVSRFLGTTLSDCIRRHGSEARKKATPRALAAEQKRRISVGSADLVDTVATDSITGHASRLGFSASKLSRLVSETFGCNYRTFRERVLTGELR